MKVFFILSSLIPCLVFCQFNTVKQCLKPAKEKCDSVWTKPDSLTIVDKTLDSIAWQMVYQQFLIDKGKDNLLHQPLHFYPPLKSIKITSTFGGRFHPIEKVWKMHSGVDLKAYYEQVYAIADGVVKTAAYGQNEGNYIVLLHGEMESIYCHLSELYCRKGQLIKGGECIGISGSSGNSTGPHLHFGITYSKKSTNPIMVIQKIRTFM